MNTPLNAMKLYRKRYYPEEIIYLKDDIILTQEKDLIITSWDTLKPRSDISSGISAYYMDKGFKVSKIYNSDHQLVYWYCDIIDTDYDAPANSITFTDLLIDIIVYEDGTVQVVDLDEIGLMLEQGRIDIKKASGALKTANCLLTEIYAGNFNIYQKTINDLESS